jgi:hypothetical protein
VVHPSFKLQMEEAAAAEREALINKNWIMENNLRLYLASMSDGARVLMGSKDDGMSRAQLEGLPRKAYCWL